MSTVQKTLFDEVKEKQHGIIFPCSAAREMPVGDERCEHIRGCDECQRLIKELDKIAYGIR